MRSKHGIDPILSERVKRTQESRPSDSLAAAGSNDVERVLLVEPDEARRVRLRQAAREVANIDGDADFLTARLHLSSKPYDWLCTNIRLGAYNGLHLAHLALASPTPIRVLVYSEGLDSWLARQVQQVGAFYESADRVDRAFTTYLRSPLPLQDRRNPAEPDRRTASRGGRRCTDSSAAQTYA
jgi:hypothetical protein